MDQLEVDGRITMSTNPAEDDVMTEDELRELDPAVVDAHEEEVSAADHGDEEEPDGGEEDGDDLGPDWDPDGSDD